MKPQKNVLLLLCIVFITTIHGQNAESDLKYFNLNGSVKSVKKLYFDAEDSLGIPVKAPKTYKKYDIIYFNPKGYTSEKKDYRKSGKLKRKLIVKFDQKGNKIEYSDYGHKENLNNRIIRIYSSDNQIITEKHQYFYSSGTSEQALSKFIYNKKGKLVEKTTLGFGGNIETRTLFSYGKQKDLIKREEEYNSEGDLRRRSSEYYNKTKLIVIEYFRNGEFEERITSSFNSKNLMTKKERTNIDNNILSSETYGYDEHGNINKETVRDNNSEYDYVYSYEYDNYNNWTKKIAIRNGVTTDIIEREIHYY